MTFNYKKVLLFGATSGIGLALATTLVENGIYVILVGRRKENLDQFVEKHGNTKADTRTFDIKNLDQVSYHLSIVVCGY
jgi:NADP-dependent 3-hydroxy acid dehydrogenase YdfG